MLDIKFIRENIDVVKDAVKNKQLTGTIDIDKLLQIDETHRSLLQQVEAHRALRNSLSDAISKVEKDKREDLIKEATSVKGELQKKEEELNALKIQFDELMLWVPNVPADDVPIGVDSTGNKVIKEEGEKPKFDFEPMQHYELGESLNIIDTERGTKIAGFRGYFIKNEAAALEMALHRMAIDYMQKQGFTFFSNLPWMVNKDYFVGTGYFPWGLEDHYTTQDGQALIGTAEVSLTSYFANETLNEEDLPVKLVGFSPCFRREIGSHGKDTKGVFRVHQFLKVEQVVLTTADEEETRKWHDQMLAYSEHMLKELGLPYRVLLMCTGDMGAGQRKKYDIETWFPARNDYGETHSDSYFLDFQARRLNMKYKTKQGDTKYVYTINNTVLATPRLLGALLENCQQEDGSVKVPKALHRYLDFKVIKPK